MSETEEDLGKIVRHLNDPEDLALEKEVRRFRNGSAENEDYYQQLRQLWELSAAAGKLEEIDKDSALDRLVKRLKPEKERRIRPALWIRNIAAVLLLPVLCYGVYQYFKEPAFITRLSGGTIDSVLLDDGTKVYLASHSSIRYPAAGGSEREVSLLAGEAFFEVAKDPSRPFSVTIDSLKVTVLGTSFNIRSSSDKVDLTVKQGKVMFEGPESKGKEILIAGQGLSYDRELGQALRYEDKAANSIAWLTRELTFVDASLLVVFQNLERYYNVSIDVEDSLSSFNKFNANFKGSNLDEILDILRETYPLHITREGQHIRVKNK